MLHGCALLLFLDTVQGIRSELAGHDSANQESCRANKMSEKEHESVWKVQSQMQDGGEKKAGGMGLLYTSLSLIEKKIVKN